MKEIALSKTLHPDDFDLLSEELALVDKHFTSAAPQHPMRRWEYAMALRATPLDKMLPKVFYDIGGAGSPFLMMIDERYKSRLNYMETIDTAMGMSLAQYVRGNPRLADAVYCISVLEHIPPKDLSRFLYHLGCLVAPGVVLFLTVDSCDCARHGTSHPDQHHFHWMREQIFTWYGFLDNIVEPLLAEHFTPLGEVQLAYNGNYVYDYTFCSYALIKDR